MAKYIYNGKMSEMDFTFHHKYSPKENYQIQENNFTLFRSWHNAEGTIFFRITSNKNLTHETKLAYALSLVQPYIYNIHLTCNSTN